MFGDIFRTEALGNKNDRLQLDRLLTVTTRFERVSLVIACSLALLIGIWMFFGSVPRGISTEGVLIAPGVRHEPGANEPGRLAEFLVTPGDRVVAGQAVARQTVPTLDREISILIGRSALLEPGPAQSAGDGGEVISPASHAARTTLLQLEASRSARELITSPVAGEVMALYSNPGDYLAAGDPVVQIRQSFEGGLPQAIAWVAPAAAQHVRQGQQARVEFIDGNGNRQSVSGEVTGAAAEPPPGWLAELLWYLPGAAGSRVSITLGREPVFSAADGTRCSIRILLPRQAPVSFLFSGLP